MARIDFRSDPPLASRVLVDASVLIASLSPSHPAFPDTARFLSYASGQSAIGRTDPIDRTLDLVDRYALLTADAYQLAVADSLGITMVATLDEDWLRAANDFDVLINR